MGDLYNTNFLNTKDALTGSGTDYKSAEIEAMGAKEVQWAILVESITGAPTTASLAAKFQVGAYEYGGYNIDYEPNADVVTWQDVAAADGFTGHLLLDGAWPAPLADQTLSTRRFVVRRLRLAFPGLVRVVMTPTFTGGTSPAFNVTSAFTMIY